MSVVYPGLDSAEFVAGFAALAEGVTRLGALFDRHGVWLRAPGPLDADTVAAFEETLSAYNALPRRRPANRRLHRLFRRDRFTQHPRSGTYERATGSDNELGQLGTRFTAWIGALDVEGLIARSPAAGAHAFALRQAKIEAEHLMSPAEEDLAAELNVTSGLAWATLHGNLSSQIVVTLESEGEVRELPISAVRNLSYDPDRDLRRAAYDAELAAGNCRASAGCRAEQYQGRGQHPQSPTWLVSPLDASLFDNTSIARRWTR